MAIALSMDFGVTGVEETTSSVKTISNNLNQNTKTVETNTIAWNRLRDAQGKFATKEQAVLAQSIAQSKLSMEETTKALKQAGHSTAEINKATDLLAENMNGISDASAKETTSLKGLASYLNIIGASVSSLTTIFNTLFFVINEGTKLSNVIAFTRGIETAARALRAFDLDTFAAKLEMVAGRLKIVTMLMKMVGME
jgi:predicted PurR-regulated permease PerM